MAEGHSPATSAGSATASGGGGGADAAPAFDDTPVSTHQLSFEEMIEQQLRREEEAAAAPSSAASSAVKFKFLKRGEGENRVLKGRAPGAGGSGSAHHSPATSGQRGGPGRHHLDVPKKSSRPAAAPAREKQAPQPPPAQRQQQDRRRGDSDSSDAHRGSSFTGFPQSLRGRAAEHEETPVPTAFEPNKGSQRRFLDSVE